ncbi:MAG: tetratricopeptide repeat protein, partial [Deltaproteobacteria bacterium]|nr:tetratricopeptide repeat protein [Deltaproteobacteria bacterium]
MLGHLALCVATAAAFEERELARIGDDITAVGIKLKHVIEDYQAKDPMGLRRFSERLADGEILFLLGDYGRASLVLYDLVEDRRHSGEPSYARAIYYLAESLHQSGQDASARSYFEELVRRGDPEFLVQSVRRLIQIADRRQQWEGLQAQVEVLAKLGGLPSDIAYIHAKSLLRQGNYQAAIEAVHSLPPDDPLYAKARYVAAVARMQLGELEQAAQLFAEITHVADHAIEAADIREQAAMNQGRLLLEAGRYAESADAYQFVPRTSSHFEEALYEVTWNYVRAADTTEDGAERAREYTKARNALEIMLLAGTETPLAPEARLLLGNILMRLAEYDLATETFDGVVS